MPPKAATEPKSPKTPRTTAKATQPKAKAARSPKGPPKVMGRPSKYSPELAAKVCAAIARGKTMRTVCEAETMPAPSTVYLWLSAHPEFSEQYARAKVEAADALVEEILDISDDGTNDWMEVHDREGSCVGYKVNGEHVQRSRLRVDTRKWIAAKLQPKKYGDKVDVNHGVQPDNPLYELMNQMGARTLKPVAE